MKNKDNIIVFDRSNSQRIYDQNGWFTVSANPITKVGVFPYLGSSMGIPGVEPNKIYYVLRPEESLKDQNFLDSIQLLPLIDDHAMLGEMGLAAEEYGVEGITGESNFYDENDRTVYAKVKVFSEDLKDSIDSGKNELSLGYTARYERQSGIFEGIRYDFVQRDLQGNHLALVAKGRMGSDVAVLDEQLSFFETEDGETMNEKQIAEALSKLRGIGFDEALLIVKSGAVPTSDAGITLDMDALSTMVKDQVSACMDGYMENVKDTVKTVVDECMKDAGTGTGMDADVQAQLDEKDAKIASQDEELTGLRSQVADQAANVELEKKNDLVGKLSPVVGAFDHDEMSLTDVAKYGLDKLGLEAPEGAELAILNTHLDAVQTSGGRFSVADKGDKETKPAEKSAVAKYVDGE